SATPAERRIRTILRSDLSRRPVSRGIEMILAMATAIVLILTGVANPYEAPDARALAQSGETAASGTDGQAAPQKEPAGSDAASAEPADKQKRDELSRQPEEPTVEIRGRVLDEQGIGVAGARVEVVAMPELPGTQTRADGTFSL